MERIPLASRPDRIRALGYRLLDLADDLTLPSRSRERAEQLIAEGEHISAAVRSEFR